MNSVGCSEDDLKVLVSKGFVQVLNEDLVSYITDWNENNVIRADRKIDSIYKDLLISMNPDVKLLEKKERSDTKKSVDGQWTDNGRSMDGPWTDNGRTMDGIGKDRIGKDSIGEEKKEKKAAKAAHAPSRSFGEYQNVKLTDAELEKLKNDFGESMTEECITYLDEYIEMKGYKAKSHYLCIRKWVVDAVNEKRTKAKPEKPKGNFNQMITNDDIYSEFIRMQEGR